MIIRTLINFFFPRPQTSAIREFAWGNAAIVTYLGMFLFTFGHVFARHPVYDFDFAPCKERPARNGTMIPVAEGAQCQYEIDETVPPMTFGKALVSSLVWPFFWSWHLQAEKPHD